MAPRLLLNNISKQSSSDGLSPMDEALTMRQLAPCVLGLLGRRTSVDGVMRKSVFDVDVLILDSVVQWCWGDPFVSIASVGTSISGAVSHQWGLGVFLTYTRLTAAWRIQGPSAAWSTASRQLA